MNFMFMDISTLLLTLHFVHELSAAEVLIHQVLHMYNHMGSKMVFQRERLAADITMEAFFSRVDFCVPS